MSKWIRSGALAGAAGLIADLHGDFGALAADAGLRAELLADPDLPIEAAAVPRFLDLASDRLDCPSFGLQLGQRQDMTLFGPLGPLIRNAANVGDLVRNLVDFFPLHTQGAIVALNEEADDWLMTYDLAADVHPSHRHVVELGFSVLIAEIARHVPNWRPAYMAFRHAPPSDRMWHDRLFGRNLLFNGDRNALMLDAGLLKHPIRITGGDQGQTPGIARPGPALADLVPFHTERLVRASLPSRLLAVSEAARLLRLSTRSLQRRLAASGTSFAAIVDAVRADLALAYLRDSDLTVAQIAETLRFSETSALSRAVRRWHGRTPRTLRKRARPA
ncbi:AraC family transcriptional regulator [Sphingopyxis sp.]|uniref:AraC family transcriptional regulator n=1 Tax=Sphingopyxis sp. TaxID=1908224 RepID=UPI0026102024|nr:AraC family transcriptional regulator [Sphingopyxis sp.]MCW0200047.1 AraC family transcriptional regulator [Sphingopyxis sp.]